jgi:ArsR family transcriptional regulator, arsenate/arsenite/antimonite-responsive transcriptional repressor / arsenate reductase (thioredoxin)
MTILSDTLPASADTSAFFRALADDTRLAIVRLLGLTDLRAGELGAQLALPQNALSYHLKQLRSIGLLRDRRSNEDGRDIYYSVDLERLHVLYAAAGDALHPAMNNHADAPMRSTLSQPLRVLFLCTHNRARSQLAEGIARYLAGDQVEAHSAGSTPTEPHPLTIEMLQEMGIPTDNLRSKSMQEFVDQEWDYVITTCDKVRGGCPVFPGDPKQIHWSFADPSAEQGAEAQRRAFQTVKREMLTRIRYLLSLPHPRTGERLKLRDEVAQRG